LLPYVQRQQIELRDQEKNRCAPLRWESCAAWAKWWTTPLDELFASDITITVRDASGRELDFHERTINVLTKIITKGKTTAHY